MQVGEPTPKRKKRAVSQHGDQYEIFRLVHLTQEFVFKLELSFDRWSISKISDANEKVIDSGTKKSIATSTKTQRIQPYDKANDMLKAKVLQNIRRKFDTSKASLYRFLVNQVRW